MGRDVAGLSNNDIANGVITNSIDAANVAPNDSPVKAEDHILKDTLTDENEEKQNRKISDPEPVEKIIEAEVENLSEMNGSSMCSDRAEKNDPSVEDLHPGQEKKMEPNFQSIARKQQFHVTKSHYEEEDNWSMASSTATSVRTTKVTVAVAPRFTCVDRLERRKEFYSKLGEKHRALEKEKHDYQSRIKEEEQVAIKLLRKNMSYKANPVPGFYHEGPPAKVELKKLPVTRPKSPNLTRRKSCGDTVTKSSTPEKILRATRHSIGAIKEAKPSPLSSKSKAQNDSPNSNGSNKVRSHPRQIKETIKVSCSGGKSNADIAVES